MDTWRPRVSSFAISARRSRRSAISGIPLPVRKSQQTRTYKNKQSTGSLGPEQGPKSAPNMATNFGGNLKVPNILHGVGVWHVFVRIRRLCVRMIVWVWAQIDLFSVHEGRAAFEFRPRFALMYKGITPSAAPAARRSVELILPPRAVGATGT